MNAAQNEIIRTLGRVEGKLDLLIDNHDDLKEDHETTKASLASVQKKVNWYSGAIATVGLLGLFLKDRLKELFFL